jgi:hydrogenase nickel incorporation protein HypA/HybF
MHELSIAESILEIIYRNVPKDELTSVRTVNMKIGALAGVVCESLEFSFQAVTSGTPLEAASLSIDRVPCRIHCSSCDKAFPSPHGFSACPGCSGTQTRVLSGMELQVVSIDLCEPVPEAP